MNELSIDSIRAKQASKAQLLVRCLAGLLVINLLTVGIASWSSISRASVAEPEFAEVEQPLPPQPSANEAVSVPKMTVIPSNTTPQPSAHVQISPSAEKTTKAPVPSVIQPEAPLMPLAVAPSGAPPATLPPENGLQETIASLKTLLARSQGAWSGINFAAAAPDAVPPEPTAPIVEHRIEAVQDLPSRPETKASAILRLVNPRETGGEVNYEVDGKSFTLRPGEYHLIPSDAEHAIEFHRGDDFGDARLIISEGVYLFEVGSTGWKLERSEKDVEASLSITP